MAKIKCIIKRPDEQYGHVTHISPRLENLQKTVEGYIETIPVQPGTIIICNEEGNLKALPPNMPYYHDTIHGTIIVCGQSGPDICDNYCKYPTQYQMEHEDSEEAFDLMTSEICAECPLNRL